MDAAAGAEVEGSEMEVTKFLMPRREETATAGPDTATDLFP